MSVFQLCSGDPFLSAEVTEYGRDLLLFGIQYRVNEHWLEVGDYRSFQDYTLYVSVLSQEVRQMVHAVAPLLHAYRAPFRLLKNAKLVDQSNGLAMGTNDAGKVMIIYPTSSRHATDLLKELELVTRTFQGIMIENCLRLGKVLYTDPQTQINYDIPDMYRVKKRKGILGKYYIPVKLLRFSSKGDVHMGVSLKNFSFTPCIIKQARAGSFIDPSGRQIYHKLLWQKTVLEDLQDKLPVPQVLDFCRKGSDHYLITSYIEGDNLSDKVFALHGANSWKDMPAGHQQELLGYLLQIADILQRLHETGYLHRDVQINNFIIKDKRVYLIDFELAYHIKAGIPDPPFGFGTLRFMSPQQRGGNTPEITDDIFSFGAVCAFTILCPTTAEEFTGNMYNTLESAGMHPLLLDVIASCMHPDPMQRPSLSSIITSLKTVYGPDQVVM